MSPPRPGHWTLDTVVSMPASPLLLLLLATAASADIVTLLSEAQSGQVLGPSHPDYEDRRKVSQGGYVVRRSGGVMSAGCCWCR